MYPSEKSFKDYFEILEVSPFVSPAVLKAAYITLSKLYHPDVSRTQPPLSGKNMSQINEAYEVLSDPAKRAGYWEKFLQHVSKVGNSKTWYFFKKWEKSLRNMEKDQKKTKEDEPHSEESLTIQILSKEYFSLRSGQRHLFFQKLSSLSLPVKEKIIGEIFGSPLFSGDKEQEMFFWLLKEKQSAGIPYLSRAFRYKNLYLLLLSYIDTFGIGEYWNKIFLIAKQLDINLMPHIDIAMQILQMQGSEDFHKSLKDWVVKEWKPLSFFQKKGKSTDYLLKYREFRKLIKEFLGRQNGKNRQSSD